MFPVIGHAYLRQKFHISWVSSPLQLQILQSIPTPTTLVCESQTLFIENWESLTQFFSNNGVWYSLTPASVPQSINANNNIPFNDPFMPSVLRRCWLGGRKGIRSVKNWVVGCWRGYLLERDADLYIAQLMPLPLSHSLSLFWYWLTRVVPGKGLLNGCV